MAATTSSASSASFRPVSWRWLIAPMLELGECSSQLVGYLLPGLAPAHQDEDRSVSQCADEVTEEEESCRFGPLHVVENEDQRSTAGDSTHQISGGVEREEPFGGVVRASRGRRRRDSRRQAGAEPASARHQTGPHARSEGRGVRARRTCG